MTSLRLSITGLDESEQVFHDISARAHNMRPALWIVQRLMQRAAIDQWATEGARSGEPWEKDAPATVEKKAAEGAMLKTEFRTGDLATSILGGPGAVRTVTNTRTRLGTRVWYAKFQGHRRRLLRLTDHDATRFSNVIINYLLTGKGDQS